MGIKQLVTFDDREALRRWLEEHHQKEREVWVATYRSRLPMPDALSYVEVVEEALCFGWIDSTVKRLPDGRLAQRLSPRRKNSHWTQLNILRCQELERRGLMTEAGRKALPIEQIQSMEQIDRIKQMESQLELAAKAVRGLADALAEYEAAQEALRELEAYYGSDEWRQDFADDEAGRLPRDLKRGVLSEDALWNLLDEWKELKKKNNITINKRR